MKNLEVQRANGQYPAAKTMQAYDRYGIVVLKEYLSPASRDELRTSIEHRLEAAKANGGALKLDEPLRRGIFFGRHPGKSGTGAVRRRGSS